MIWFSSVQFSSVDQSCLTLCDPMNCSTPAPLSITNSWSLLKLTSIELVMPSNHLILCHPLVLPPSVFPSIRAFSNESVLPIRWPKYWSFSFSISPSNEHAGLISLRMDWLDPFGVQGTLKSLLQYHSSKASVLWHSAFFIVQLSHPYMTTGKTIALTRCIFVGKVMSLLFNMLSRFVIAFLPRSKCLLHTHTHTHTHTWNKRFEGLNSFDSYTKMDTLLKRTNARSEHVDTGKELAVLPEKRVKSQGDAEPWEGWGDGYSGSQAKLTGWTVLLQVGIFCTSNEFPLFSCLAD